ncbi:claudin-11a [Nerophis ophidion]|uniref:claudin-11a n=1 Tax=Nerophis ophidion TaxID=159077 RepID=UPI002ADF7D13|nr:claudin-11a [Nerophis ophidion]
MANSCLQIVGFVCSCLGWVGIVVASATNDWVVLCKYSMNTCMKMDDLGTKGPWAECLISTKLYHCNTYTQLLDLPAYIQATRALMVAGSILGLPAVVTILMSLPCIVITNEPQRSKNKRAVVGGVLVLLVALCGLVSTILFPIGVSWHDNLMAFGFSLYAGWAGVVLSLLGGCMLTCCSSSSASSRPYQDNAHYYYSKSGKAAAHPDPASSANHAKSAHV